MNTFNTSTNLRPMNILSHNRPQTQRDGTLAAPNQTEAQTATAGISFIESHPLLQLKQSVGPQQHMGTIARTNLSSVAIFDQPQLHFTSDTRVNFGESNAVTERYFTTSVTPDALATHPAATVLFTNTFTTHPNALLQKHQEHHEQQNNAIADNVKVVPPSSTTAPLNQLVKSHIFNIGDDIDKDIVNNELLHLQQQQIYEQQQQLLHHSHFGAEQQIPTLLPLQSTNNPHHYTAAHFAHQKPLQQFYTTSASISVADTSSSSLNNVQLQSNSNQNSNPFSQIATCSTSTSSANSTVVLDRINICINNHYSEVGAIASPVAIQTSLSTTPPQQPSPIIPAIQHKAVVDSPQALMDPFASTESSRSVVIDEPDSTTTTPQTPPITPDNITPECNHIAGASTTIAQTPKNWNVFGATKGIKICSTSLQQTATTTLKNNRNEENNVAHLKKTTQTVSTFEHPETSTKNKNTEEIQRSSQQIHQNVQIKPRNEAVQNKDNTFVTQSPHRPAPVMGTFAIGEDVLIKRPDERFYLGTITDAGHHQFLVRFDDNSEFWSSADEMRKLNNEISHHKGQMCVACKRSEDSDVVEICERCGRGYHRNCTEETATGSENWMCKRCAKPMKMLKTSICSDRMERDSVLQLPYDINSLNWNDKPRVNEEHIYCYCGKSGKLHDNMLQCCRCKNWYHRECTDCATIKMLRGDNFFVFCCSVCNNGQEFIRRLQMDWIDTVHLILYNLSATKKHLHQKYHNLIKDIWPFALEQRINIAIPKAWLQMPTDQFKEKIKRTLNTNTERFMCGREIKRDPLYYALRSNRPPPSPKVNIGPNDVLSDVFLTKTLNLTLLRGFFENENSYQMNLEEYSPEFNKVKPKVTHQVNDVYEFRIEDDEKFTSDDEIPIKHIMEKAKKSKTLQTSKANIYCQNYNKSSIVEKIDMDDSNDGSDKSSPRNYEKLLLKPDVNIIKATLSGNKKKDNKLDVPKQSSRKRKAFALFKTYKETAAGGGDTRICDSSSDENSSSSRGTSLDLIIPPPKNFLGLNNPFRMITPKKTTAACTVGVDKKAVNFSRRGSILKKNMPTMTNLDFSAKLAALKSCGIFSNLSSSDLAKAAGQPRLVRTIKRRLSAKDITIGPNQEVRRRRIRRLSSNVEVISTTTINSFPSNYIPIHAKDTNSSTAAVTNQKSCSLSSQNPNNNYMISSTNSSASSCSVEYGSMKTSSTTQLEKPQHGRRLRQRPEKCSPNTSRRSSISGASTSSSSSTLSAGAPVTSHTCAAIQDLKQSVTKYFGAVNRIESGEKFLIRATRRLASGQMQYLIEWGGDVPTSSEEFFLAKSKLH